MPKNVQFRSKKTKLGKRKVYPIISGKRATVKRNMTTASVVQQQKPLKFSNDLYELEKRKRQELANLDPTHPLLNKYYPSTFDAISEYDRAIISIQRSRKTDPEFTEVPVYRVRPEVSTKDLQEIRHEQSTKLYEIEKKVYRGEIDEKEYDRIRESVYTRQHALKPDIRPLIYRRTIGHYGGDYIDVPAENYQEFKSYFPKREWPKGDNIQKKDIREEWTAQGEAEFRKKFPNSNYLYQIYFAPNTKGEQRLEFFKINEFE